MLPNIEIKHAIQHVYNSVVCFILNFGTQLEIGLRKA